MQSLNDSANPPIRFFTSQAADLLPSSCPKCSGGMCWHSADRLVCKQAETAPRKQCYCKKGYFGDEVILPGGTPTRKCTRQSTLSLGDYTAWENEYAASRTSTPTGNYTVYWNIDPDKGEIEYAISLVSDAWVSVGLRPEFIVGAMTPPASPAAPTSEAEGEAEAPAPESEAEGEAEDHSYGEEPAAEEPTAEAEGATAEVVTEPEVDAEAEAEAAPAEPEAAAEGTPEEAAAEGDHSYPDGEPEAPAAEAEAEAPAAEAEAEAAVSEAEAEAPVSEAEAPAPASAVCTDFPGSAPSTTCDADFTGTSLLDTAGAPPATSEAEAEAEGETDAYAEGEVAAEAESETTRRRRRARALLDGHAEAEAEAEDHDHYSEPETDPEAEGEAEGEAEAEAESAAVPPPTADMQIPTDGILPECGAMVTDGGAFPMINLDVVMAMAMDDTFRVYDAFTPSRSRPFADVYFGGRDDIVDAVGEQIQTSDGSPLTLIKFRRPLQSSDAAADYCYVPGMPIP